MQDLHDLPKLRDSLSYLYVEHAVIERSASSIELIQKQGRTAVPAAALSVLLLGPGTNITHAAIKVLGECGCSILWVGEGALHYYAQGGGETRKSYHLLVQAELTSNPDSRLRVIYRMYEKRFQIQLDLNLSLEQVRGMEGARVRSTYAQASQKYGVHWIGRRYDRSNWGNADPVNRALSSANALLNGICYAAIISGGYSPALGFIHTGRQTSFVYDIADLYKTELTIPIAFEIISQGTHSIEKRVRCTCRERFHTARLLERILPDIDDLLDIREDRILENGDPDSETSMPGPLWDVIPEEFEEATI